VRTTNRCEKCGAYLGPQEKCTCEDEKEQKHENLISMLWGNGEQMRLENLEK